MKVFIFSTTAATAVVLCLFLSETMGAPPAKIKAVTTRKSKVMNGYESTPGYAYSTIGATSAGPPGASVNPACMVCRVLSRTKELGSCIKDPQVLEFFATMKSECVKDIGSICPAPNNSPTTPFPDYYDPTATGRFTPTSKGRPQTSPRRNEYTSTYRPKSTDGRSYYSSTYRPYDYTSSYGDYSSGYYGRRLRPYQQLDLPSEVIRNRNARNAICIACFGLARFNDLIECLFDPEDLTSYESFMQGCAQNFFMCIRT